MYSAVFGVWWVVQQGRSVNSIESTVPCQHAKDKASFCGDESNIRVT